MLLPVLLEKLRVCLWPQVTARDHVLSAQSALHNFPISLRLFPLRLYYSVLLGYSKVLFSYFLRPPSIALKTNLDEQEFIHQQTSESLQYTVSTPHPRQFKSLLNT